MLISEDSLREEGLTSQILWKRQNIWPPRFVVCWELRYLWSVTNHIQTVHLTSTFFFACVWRWLVFSGQVCGQSDAVSLCPQELSCWVTGREEGTLWPGHGTFHHQLPHTFHTKVIHHQAHHSRQHYPAEECVVFDIFCLPIYWYLALQLCFSVSDQTYLGLRPQLNICWQTIIIFIEF